MGPILLLALQAGAAQGAPPPIARIDFDLARVEPFDPAEIGRLAIWAEACGTEQSDDIVVCGRRGAGDRHRPGPLLPDPPTAMDELGDALSTTIGPFRIGSVRQADGTRRLGIGLKF